jgi:hypothetical protein
MSKQLSIAAAASIFAMSALALFAPGSAKPSDALSAAAPQLALASQPLRG